GEAQSGRKISQSAGYYPWVMGWLDWGASAHNTNTLFLTDPDYAVLANYSARAAKIYKCPADNFVHPAQRQRGFKERVRSVSMNGAVGFGNKVATDGLLLCERLFVKTSDVINPAPANLWVFVDEHPDSINDGAFFNAQNSSEWIDLPGNYHNNACGFAFADGHSEIHKWKSSVTRFPIKLTDFSRTAVSRTDVDYRWIVDRTSAPR
ncbi:MAG: prepilin-type cleavage/methylation domain-containing protein, partial [Verrucomicrobia bacterium]|nr:prepilin-type cleavage/methylation domain-containing protein [Verrucomicrobiota bacterium]